MRAKEENPLFDIESGTKFCRSKNLSVRVPPLQRQKLEVIARERHWQLSQMVNKMIDNFIQEYEKLPKPKQDKFEFVK
jgi:hypothetical protein